MNKLRIILILFATILIAFTLVFYTDYSDLSWSNNRGSYLDFISMLLLIIAMISSIISEKKNKGKE